jgi:hypothetical protein
MKDSKYWIKFMLEILPYIKDKDDRAIVEKRLTKKMEMFFKIIKSELKEAKLLKK